MSDFFEPPPEPAVPEPRRYRQPAWLGAPQGTLPGIVAMELVLARTEKVAVCVSRIAAYPTGFECDVVTMATPDQPEFDPMLFHHHPHSGHGIAEVIPPEMLRLGIQFADGLKATNFGGFHHHRQPLDGPVMVFGGGGGGGGGHWRVSQWVWPLPPPGPITLVCEWPAMDIPLTRHELDAKTIRDAAKRAQVIFSDDHLPEFPDENEDL